MKNLLQRQVNIKLDKTAPTKAWSLSLVFLLSLLIVAAAAFSLQRSERWLNKWLFPGQNFQTLTCQNQTQPVTSAKHVLSLR